MLAEIKHGLPRGRVKAPPSKSMAHRLLICAGLSRGESVIENVSFSQDILATLDCLAAFGARIKKEESRVILSGADLSAFRGGELFCRESGSTLRFLLPVAMLCKEKSLFVGQGRLMERPMEIYEELAAEKGLLYEKNEKGISVSGVLEGGTYTLRGDVSSQFVSGLLFALPLAEGDSRILLTVNTESLSYILMTIEALRLFGVEIKRENENEFYIRGSQEYQPRQLSVEGDYSNAAFLDAFNLLGGEIEVTGLCEKSLQGDRIYKEYFSLLREGTPELAVSDCPDLAPVLMTLAAALNGARLTGTRRLKIKESDRGEAMKRELSLFGAQIDVRENEIIIEKSPLHPPSARLQGHNDHRVVMSLAVLSSLYTGEIDGCEAVSKSYPDFFEVMKKSGMEVMLYDNK